MIEISDTLLARFWPKINLGDDLECWEWTARTLNGYGSIAIKTGPNRWTPTYAHRIAWTIAFGQIPDGLCVCHNCPTGDNPRCCNPAHLWLGTRAENSADMKDKGRASGARVPLSGERNPASKVRERDVCDIRDRFARGGETKQSIANSFGITRQAIFHIVTGRNWRDIQCSST